MFEPVLCAEVESPFKSAYQWPFKHSNRSEWKLSASSPQTNWEQSGECMFVDESNQVWLLNKILSFYVYLTI